MFANVSIQSIARTSESFHFLNLILPGATVGVCVKVVTSVAKLNRDEVVPYFVGNYVRIIIPVSIRLHSFHHIIEQNGT